MDWVAAHHYFCCCGNCSSVALSRTDRRKSRPPSPLPDRHTVPTSVWPLPFPLSAFVPLCLGRHRQITGASSERRRQRRLSSARQQNTHPSGLSLWPSAVARDPMWAFASCCGLRGGSRKDAARNEVGHGTLLTAGARRRAHASCCPPVLAADRAYTSARRRRPSLVSWRGTSGQQE